jgi:menaquinone-dependent protoporphyrinogen IX oxidase
MDPFIKDINKICEKCYSTCSAILFQQNFEYWTSGNDDIDKFIQNTQLSTHEKYKVFENALEWIPYDRFYDIKYIAEKKVYRTNWIDGSISHWDDKNQNWMRENQNMIITLKSFDNPKNIALESMNEV